MRLASMASSGSAACAAKVALVLILVYQCSSINDAMLIPGVRAYRGIDGGLSCAACTVLVSLVEQAAEVNNRTVTEILETVCNRVPDNYRPYCLEAVDLLGPPVIQMLAEELNADFVCSTLNFCHIDVDQPQCRLYKTVKPSDFTSSRLREHSKKFGLHLRKFGIEDVKALHLCNIPGVNVVCNILNSTFKQHLPAHDSDSDLFSTVGTLRGSSWRGKDCNDLRSDIRPGARPLHGDIYDDSNCNGIYGLDKATGTSYESKWCDESGKLGVIVVGDSAGAHFHFPEEWINPLLMTEAAFKDFNFIIGNELDWPQLSFVTGYMNSTWSVVKDPTDSIYLKLRQRNLCNHRDYQNIAVNGDDSFEVQSVVQSLARDPAKDVPALVIVELMGNDVCNNNPDTVAHMTTPEQMTSNILVLLHQLDKKLPNGSHVLIMGLADGDYLYQFLQNRIHPLGALRQDLTYTDIYDWWNCLQVTPCYGWLNSNSTVRTQTTQRAVDLSSALKAVTEEYRFNNFDMSYLDNPVTPIIDEWLKEHGSDSGWQLIEAVDGFHPNQIANFLTAQYMWNYLEKYLPHFIGQPNPHNSDILATFGDQGGH